MYQIVRIGSGYDPIIVVSPYGTGPFSTEGAGHLLDSRNEGWQEISLDAVACYFSGIADGMGFEVPPKDDFESLAAVEAWVASNRPHFTDEERASIIQRAKEVFGDLDPPTV